MNRFRIALSKIVVHTVFEMMIFGIVILSAILMMIEDPLADPKLPIFAYIGIAN